MFVPRGSILAAGPAARAKGCFWKGPARANGMKRVGTRKQDAPLADL